MDKNTARLEVQLIISSLVLVFFLFALTLIFRADAFRSFFIGEGGLVEGLSGLGYLAVIGVMLYSGGETFLKQHISIAVILLAFAAREFDFDKRFTDMGVLKSEFYVSADVAILQKLIAGLVVLGVLAAAGMTVRTYGASFMRAVREGRPYGWAIGIGIIVMVISKGVLDGFHRKTAGLGIDVSIFVKSTVGDFEECLELSIPLLFMIGVFGFFRHARAGSIIDPYPKEQP